jgi:hypothetical protein
MDALIDSFYNSYSSSQDQKDQQRRADPSMFDEIELLKVTGCRSDLERLNRNIGKLKKRWNLDISAFVVVPEEIRRRHRMEERQRYLREDFLDDIFTVKIPLFHDLIMMGEPECEYLRIEGSHGEINVLNRLIETVVYDKGINVNIVVAQRKKVFVESSGLDRVVPTMNDLDHMLDSIYSADFSKSFPTLHRILTA